jgi:adenine-specific DNA glycosylase
MLQQTQVSRVIGYYTRFLERFPTVETLAVTKWEDFLPYYAGLGYYARGRNMLRTAHEIVQEHGGVFSRTVAELERLPGIGPYTARAIASFAYGAPELAWDTNLRRVIGRFFLGGKGTVTPTVEARFASVLGRHAAELNAALMDFGASLCTARPKCAACSLRKACRYFREGGRGEQKAIVRPGNVSAMAHAEQTAVILHENHTHYFSSRARSYAPFLLPGRLTRAAIKEHFSTLYGLVLAVRPPHGTIRIRGRAAMLVHAQILLGTPSFPVFPKSAVLRYTGANKRR